MAFKNFGYGRWKYPFEIDGYTTLDPEKHGN
jgi:hypothetical protein